MHRGVRTSSAATAPIDADALAAKLGDAIGERIETALADYEPAGDGAPPDRTAEMVKTVTDALAPILALAAARLGPAPNGGGQPAGSNGGRAGG